MNVVAKEATTPLDSRYPQEPPVNVHAWEDLAAVMRHANRARATGDLQRACAFYSRAIDLDPNSAQAWAGRASTTSNLDEAIFSWGYSLALASDGEARKMLSACVAEKIKQSGKDEVGSLIAVGRRLAEAGQWNPADRLFTRATELAPSNEEAWVWRAGVAGDASETVAYLKRVLELNPQNVRAKAGLQWASSMQTAPSVSSDGSEQAAMAMEDGQRALREGDRLRAYERFKRATELDAQNVAAWFWQGSTAPNIDEALACMDQVLVIEPDNEAAKDARWWLRVQKLREGAPALTNTKPPAIDPYAETFKPRNNRIVIFIALFLMALLACGLLALAVTLRLAGYLG